MEGEMAVKTGECRFCGQVRTLKGLSKHERWCQCHRCVHREYGRFVDGAYVGTNGCDLGHWEATGEKKHLGEPPWPCREFETADEQTFNPDGEDPQELDFDDPKPADPELDPWWDGSMDWESPFD